MAVRVFLVDQRGHLIELPMEWSISVLGSECLNYYIKKGAFSVSKKNFTTHREQKKSVEVGIVFT